MRPAEHRAIRKITSKTPARRATLFDGVSQHIPAKRALLTQLYESLGRTADDLPYTPHFESLYEPYIADYHDPKPDRAEVWRHLLNIRKAGKLPKLGEAHSKPPEVSDEAREHLRKLLGDDLGKRDRLPYTARFEEIVEAFNETQARETLAAPGLEAGRDDCEMKTRMTKPEIRIR